MPALKARFLAIYKLHGAAKLPEEAEVIHLLSMQDPIIGARLTTKPEADFHHVDMHTAIGSHSLKWLFGKVKARPLREWLPSVLSDVRDHRIRRIGTGVFVVFNGEVEVDASDIHPHAVHSPNDPSADGIEYFGCWFGGISKVESLEIFRPIVRNVILSLNICLNENNSYGVENLGEILYYEDSDNSYPIYAIDFDMSGRISLASSISESSILLTKEMVPLVCGDDTLNRCTRLLFDSLQRGMGDLESFLFAWSAIEIFVNRMFKLAYSQQKNRNISCVGATSVGSDSRLRPDGTKEESYLGRKFLVIVLSLNCIEMVQDMKTFERLKKIRDGLFHGKIDAPVRSLPTEEVQRLLIKYLKLHLTAQERLR